MDGDEGSSAALGFVFPVFVKVVCYYSVKKEPCEGPGSEGAAVLLCPSETSACVLFHTRKALFGCKSFSASPSKSQEMPFRMAFKLSEDPVRLWTNGRRS